MSGYLDKSSVKMPGGASEGEADADIFGMVFNGIGSGLKLGLKTFTDTIKIVKPKKKKYFAIKGGTLYWYVHERAREAEKHIDIKHAKTIDISPENNKEFYIIVKRKCYRLLCQHDKEAQKWVNSLKAVRDGTLSTAEEHLDP